MAIMHIRDAMSAYANTTLKLLLLLAIGLPGGLGMGMHVLGPDTDGTATSAASQRDGCSCCHHHCAATEMSTVAATHDCLICKFLVAAKQADTVDSPSLGCEPPVAEYLPATSSFDTLAIALPISARGPPV